MVMSNLKLRVLLLTLWASAIYTSSTSEVKFSYSIVTGDTEDLTNKDVFAVKQNSTTVIRILNQNMPTLFRKQLNIIKCQRIIIKNCGIKSLEPGILNNTMIEYDLTITDNDFPLIASKTFENIKVRFITLTQNNIEIIGNSAFKSLEDLTEINLSGNRLTVVHHEWFESTPKINVLFIESNNLTKLEQNCISFMDREELLLLSFFNNMINYINENTFDERQILYLNLSHNQLSNLSPEMFKDGIRYEMIDLSYNKLKTVPETMLSRSFNTVYLTKNEFDKDFKNKMKKEKKDSFKL